MEALSRREETDILERGKKDAMVVCEQLVQDFADCAKGRTFSVVWSCNGKLSDMKACMKNYLSVEKIDTLKKEYMLDREERTRAAVHLAKTAPPKTH